MPNFLKVNDVPVSAIDLSDNGEGLPFLLLDSFYDTSSGSTVFKTRLLPGQPAFEAQLADGVSLADLKPQVDTAAQARRPMGTVFITSDYALLTAANGSSSVMVNNFKPLIHEMEILPLASGLTNEIRTQIDYLLRHIGRNEAGVAEYGGQAAKDIAEQYAGYSYDPDWQVLLADPEVAPVAVVPDVVPTAPAGSLLAQLMEDYPCPAEADHNFHIEEKLWRDMIYNWSKGYPMLLTGPTGSGKTKIVKVMALVVGQTLFIQDMSTVQDAQASLLGTHRLDETGKSVFEYAPFVDYIKSGNIVLLDEVNRGSIASGNYLLPLLDERRYLPVDMAGHDDERHIAAHPKTWFVCTANEGADYSSTQAIDRALEDRLLRADLDYLDMEAEIRILMLETGIDETRARTLVIFANQTREEYKTEDLGKAVSVRHTLAVAQRVADGYGLLDAIESVIYPLYPDGEDSERSKVRGMCAGF